ncbi:hypothetical protein [Caballeronia sp. GAWG1-1]|uniref:hypothetical protein n=1 Tax=Caballeronia sp. GAWG1-1 TaxID=2921742 RepID=UPI0020295F3C|nr:hypothetical protein [Caballeronia sp. GAWG1-1]
MTDNSQDMGLKALLGSAEELEPTLSPGLIEAAYVIERTHQFNRESPIASQELGKLIEEYIGADDQG